MPRRHTIVGIGELLWDLFPDGSRRLGGAPANVAYHATLLGDRGVVATRVGQDAAGKEAIALLDEQGVDVSLVQRDARRCTGVTRIGDCETPGAEPCFAVDPSAAWSAPQWTDDWQRLFASADAICFGTLLCAGPTGRRVVERAARAIPAAALRLLDLNLRPPHTPDDAVDAALACANAVKLSAREADALAGRLGVADAGAHLVARGCRLVAVTRGSHGSLLYTSAGLDEHPGFPLEDGEPHRDTVGAGDAFTAALVHHLVRGHRTVLANAAANRYAAHVASRAGAMPDIPEALRREVTSTGTAKGAG